MIRNLPPTATGPLSALALLALVGMVAAPRKAWPLTPAEESLAAAERAFAGKSLASGMRTAFLTFFAEDGIMFRPGPVNAIELLKTRPEMEAALAWEPAYVEVARAGDLGLSTGPWEIREGGPDGNPVAYGNFVTVWRKQADGEWKVEIDHGTSNPAPSKRVGAGTAVAGPSPGIDAGGAPPGASPADDLKRDLLETDRGFSKASAAGNASSAYEKYAADDVRVLREDVPLSLGKKAAKKAVVARRGRLTWEPIAAVVSASGDLGYSYGSSEFKEGAVRDPAQPGHYLRVWRRRPGGSWRVIVDVLTADPPPPKESPGE